MCACCPRSIIVGGQATAYSHPSQLDILLSLQFGGDPLFGDNTIGAKHGDDAAVVEHEGNCKLGILVGTVE